MKKIIIYIFLIILIVAIFLFSGQTGGNSIKTSDEFTGKIIDKVASITGKEISIQTKKRLIYKTRFIVRKAAHFTLYFTLGIIVYLLLTIYNVKQRLIISSLICFVFACCDEFHQLFIVGRTARFYDCLVDTLGSITSLLIIGIIIKIKEKIDEKNNKKQLED